MAGNSIEAGRSVTNKITSILMTFTEGSAHTLTEISQLAGLPISTAHRLTSELASWRLLERTPDGRYRAGLPLRMMGSGDACRPELRERGPCVLEDLSRATGCRARMGVLQEFKVAYIEKQPGPQPVSSFMPAAMLPLHPTALGRVLLAFAPPSIVEMCVRRGLRAYTPHTVTSPDRLRRALAVVRTSRVAVTRFELEATTCGIAVPVFGPGGELAAAIELTVPDVGREAQPMIASLSIAARSLSRELSGGALGRLDPERAGYATRAAVQDVGCSTARSGPAPARTAGPDAGARPVTRTIADLVRGDDGGERAAPVGVLADGPQARVHLMSPRGQVI